MPPPGCPTPAPDGGRLNDHERLAPSSPEARKETPAQPIAAPEAATAFVHPQLVLQRHVLEDQVGAVDETRPEAGAPITKALEHGHTYLRTAVITGAILADEVLAPRRVRRQLP